MRISVTIATSMSIINYYHYNGIMLRYLSATSTGPVFGVSLTEAVKRSRVNENLPLCRVFQDCIMYIETFGMHFFTLYSYVN